jgi:hypothetical protein
MEELLRAIVIAVTSWEQVVAKALGLLVNNELYFAIKI